MSLPRRAAPALACLALCALGGSARGGSRELEDGPFFHLSSFVGVTSPECFIRADGNRVSLLAQGVQLGLQVAF